MVNKSFMRRCFDLALRGSSFVAPNPLVGCVITLNNKIIGEGYHSKFGKEHAEVKAIQSVRDKKLLKRSTLYVNLEPCSHTGKTPPCSDLIIKNSIPNVVISNVDPHSNVNGSGISKLVKAGINVTKDVLSDEGKFLNRRFFRIVNSKRPYITLKWAKSTNGFIGSIINGKKGPVNISNPISNCIVHKWRSEEQAILIGHGTALSDNPLLNVRHWHGQNPVRLVIEEGSGFKNINGFSGNGGKLYLLSELRQSKEVDNVSIIHIQSITPKLILSALANKNISSVLIEGGKRTLQNFIDEDLWDECHIITGSGFINKGVTAPKLVKRHSYEQKIGNDTIKHYYNEEGNS